jgi:hypothetical protein
MFSAHRQPRAAAVPPRQLTLALMYHSAVSAVHFRAFVFTIGLLLLRRLSMLFYLSCCVRTFHFCHPSSFCHNYFPSRFPRVRPLFRGL